jgi:ribose 5-phosphate isomerase B
MGNSIFGNGGLADKQGSALKGGIMRIGIAADHGGFALKEDLRVQLTAAGHTVLDFGSYKLDANDDFPDFVIPLSHAVASGKVERGVAVCGSGVGAAICANKVPGVRAGLINDHYSARQGVEDDHMNVICLGGRVMGSANAWDLIETFLAAQYSQAERFLRRLGEIAALERKPTIDVGGPTAIPA